MPSESERMEILYALNDAISAFLAGYTDLTVSDEVLNDAVLAAAEKLGI